MIGYFQETTALFLENTRPKRLIYLFTCANDAYIAFQLYTLWYTEKRARGDTCICLIESNLNEVQVLKSLRDNLDAIGCRLSETRADNHYHRDDNEETRSLVCAIKRDTARMIVEYEKVLEINYIEAQTRETQYFNRVKYKDKGKQIIISN